MVKGKFQGNVTLEDDVFCGRCAFVGAGAVVTRDVPDFALVAGVQAKIIGWMCECGVKIEFSGKKGTCLACRKKYLKDSAGSLKPGK